MNEPYAVAPFSSSFSGAPPLDPDGERPHDRTEENDDADEHEEPVHLTRLLEDATGRVQITIRILLEDALAFERVERVDPILVPNAEGAIAQRRAADHAAGRAHAGSTSR